MNFSDLENRIQNIEVDGKPLFRQVLTAVDQEAVLNNGLVRQDAAFIVPMQESAPDEFMHTFTTSQEVQMKFGVVISVREANDRLGRNVNDRIQAIYRAVSRNLIGWEPPGTNEPIAFESGETILFGQGGAFWMDTYNTSYIQNQE